MNTPIGLRKDLVVSRHQQRDGVSYIIKDPATGRFFRIGEVEHFLAERLDGVTPLEQIRKATEETFGAHIRSEMFFGFVDRLRRTGLLETDSHPSPDVRPSALRRRLMGTPPYLQWKALDP